jgi:hypothetical protein
VSKGIAKGEPESRMMDGWAASELIDWAAGKKAIEETKTKLRDELNSFAIELAGPSPSPIEIAIADAAAMAWFALRLFEARYASSATSGDGMTIAQSEHAHRKIDRAHRRYVSTLKALAAVRRLAVPALQINVAHRQQIAQLNSGGSS